MRVYCPVCGPWCSIGDDGNATQENDMSVKYVMKDPSNSFRRLKPSVVLANDDDDSAIVRVMDEHGIDWNLILLHVDGTFELCRNVPDNIGLKVDSDGRIVERVRGVP